MREMSRREFMGGALALVSAPDDIEAVFNRVYRLFRFKRDARESRADRVRAGLPFTANCVGFARTCRDLLRERGYRPFLRSCVMPDGTPHMVCQCNGKILDNTYPAVRTVEQATSGSRYLWVRIYR